MVGLKGKFGVFTLPFISFPLESTHSKPIKYPCAGTLILSVDKSAVTNVLRAGMLIRYFASSSIFPGKPLSFS